MKTQLLLIATLIAASAGLPAADFQTYFADQRRLGFCPPENTRR